MEIIDIKSEVVKWEQNEGTFDTLVRTGETHNMLLYKHTPIYKSMFTMTGIFYITCPDTDFILDVAIKSHIEFDAGGKPTTDNLYTAYINARNRWLGIILQESMKNGFNLWIQAPPVPIERLNPYFEQALIQAYLD